ncbi:hypothetical protein ASD02_36125 [Ensifer sp. Root1252]|nr:hypothetical protein ASD02_36125 [Ensifer sp. Root1252]KRC62242.1 hypothetical protein ASE32_36215 [Ensifer sp. Root231]KRC91141.1 hypothetical protein ASE47_36185 [Ensifer sp. Root258]
MPLVRKQKDDLRLRICAGVPVGNEECRPACRPYKQAVGPEEIEGGLHRNPGADPMNLVDKLVPKVPRHDAVAHSAQFSRSRWLPEKDAAVGIDRYHTGFRRNHPKKMRRAADRSARADARHQTID